MLERHILLFILTVISFVASTQVIAETKEEDRTRIIATRHAPPFAIKTANGWEGITIELVHRIAKELDVPYSFREMDLEEMLVATASGDVDAAAAALTPLLCARGPDHRAATSFVCRALTRFVPANTDSTGSGRPSRPSRSSGA